MMWTLMVTSPSFFFSSWTLMVTSPSFFFSSNKQISPSRRPLSRVNLAQPPTRNHYLLVLPQTDILVSHVFLMYRSTTVFTLCGKCGAANSDSNSWWITDRMLETRYDNRLTILAIETNQFVALKLVASI